MPNEEDQMPIEIWCDLLERELKIALEDLEKIRKSDKAQAKNTCHMLRADDEGVRISFDYDGKGKWVEFPWEKLVQIKETKAADLFYHLEQKFRQKYEKAVLAN
jgi:hypothetical protein